MTKRCRHWPDLYSRLSSHFTVPSPFAINGKIPRMFSLFRRSPNRFRHSAYFEGVLGTSLEFQIVAWEDSNFSQIEQVILDEIDRLEKTFNAYNPSSELRLWQETREQDAQVSNELTQVLSQAEQWRQHTDGAFNPAVEALTRLWTQHAQTDTPIAQQELTDVLTNMNSPLWTASLEQGTARCHTTLPVTLNSIAKGFIIDAACRVATQQEGVQEVLINIGGDLKHAGSKPLVIAVADPRNDAENAVPAARVKIHNQGLATSGNYRRGFEIQGRWYSHVLDPRSGWPVEELVGVSVVAPDAITADVLATAFCVLRPSQSLELADGLGGIGVILIDSQGQRFSNAFWDNCVA